MLGVVEKSVSTVVRGNRITDDAFEDLAPNWGNTYLPAVIVCAFLPDLKKISKSDPPPVIKVDACVQCIAKEVGK